MGAEPELSIVLPAHNEAGNISAIAAAIAQAMALAGSYEIVFVDDGSSDGTLAAIRSAAHDPAVVDIVNGMEDQDIFLRGLVRWLGFPLVTLPYTRGIRQSGETKFSAARMVELALSGIATHSLRPLRFAIWLALGFALLSLLFIVYAIVSFLFVQHP